MKTTLPTLEQLNDESFVKELEYMRTHLTEAGINEEAAKHGDGDVVAIANTTVAITFVDDVNIGSYVDFQCAADGTWLVSGHLVIDGVANVPTLA